MMSDAHKPASRRRLLLGIVAIIVLVGAIIITAVLATGGVPTAAPTTSATPEPEPEPEPMPTVTPEALVSICPVAEAPPTPAGIPAERAVNVGVEDLVDPTVGHLDALATRFDQVGANSVSISVGRLDWIELPWVGQEQNLSSDVIETGRDYVGEAVNAFRCAGDGTQRKIVLGIDTLFGRDIQRGVVPAGQALGGWSSELFGSITAWKSDALKQRLAALVRELAVRYEPDAINITELFFDVYTFGADDLADFQRVSGLDDWPRTADGSVDTANPAVSSWRTDAVTGVLAELTAVLDPLDIALTADVRGPRDALTPTRADIGQDYPAMLEYAEHLNVWDFPGVNQRLSVLDADDLAPLLFADAPDSYSLEIGLWHDDGVIAPDILRRELTVANTESIRSVSVTPTSLMTDELWAVLAEGWQAPIAP